eukprot:6194105-Pleurochrysis_carterae.AAC.5
MLRYQCGTYTPYVLKCSFGGTLPIACTQMQSSDIRARHQDAKGHPYDCEQYVPKQVLGRMVFQGGKRVQRKRKPSKMHEPPPNSKPPSNGCK